MGSSAISKSHKLLNKNLMKNSQVGIVYTGMAYVMSKTQIYKKHTRNFFFSLHHLNISTCNIFTCNSLMLK